MSVATPPPGDNPPVPLPVVARRPTSADRWHPATSAARLRTGPTPGVAPDGRQYAEWIWRVLAYIIDYIPA